MTVHDPVHDMATSAYLSQQGPPSNGPGAGAGEQEADGVMNLVNTNTSQGYTLPREQVVGSTLKRRFLSSSIQHPTSDTVTAVVKTIYHLPSFRQNTRQWQNFQPNRFFNQQNQHPGS